jgi:RimJ/RimL family protein N-acetyltransferase
MQCDNFALLEILTERLVLRRPRPDDVPAIVLACQDPDVPRFMPEVSIPYGEPDARRFLASVERAWRESDERTFAIAGTDDLYLGSVSITLREGGNVGYMLSPSARGHGFTTEAVRALVRWAHEAHGIKSLQLWTHPDNLASQAVAERAGFARRGKRRCDTPFRDGSTVGILFKTRTEPGSRR